MTAGSPSRSQRAKSLAGELERIAKRLVPRVFGAENLNGKRLEPLAIPNISLIAEQLQVDLWRAGKRVEALEYILKETIRKLEGPFGGPVEKERRVTNQEVMLRYFNLGGTQGWLPHVHAIDVNHVRYRTKGRKGYERVRHVLIEDIGFIGGTSTLRSYIARLRRDLAEILIDLSTPSTDEHAGSVVPPPDQVVAGSKRLPTPSRNKSRAERRFRNVYIDRTHEELKVHDLLCRNQVVMLVGDAGIGKTRLAYQVATKFVPSLSKFAFLDARTERTLSADILRRLRSIGKDTNGDDRPPTLRFADLLETEDLECVLIDNLEDEQLLNELIPDKLNARVLITARRRLAPDIVDAYHSVDPMTEDEALSLITSIGPERDIADKKDLAKALGYHPLGLEIACGFLRSNEKLTVTDFLDSIRKNPLKTVGSRTSESERNVLAIQAETLKQLETRDLQKPEVLLLEAISCLSGAAIPKDLLTAYYCHRIGVPQGPGHETLCLRALDMLEERCLIRARKDDVSLHLLAQAAWRALFNDRIVSICTAINSMIKRTFCYRSEELFESFYYDDQGRVLGEFDRNRDVINQLLPWDDHHQALLDALEGAHTQADERQFGAVGYGSAVAAWIYSEARIADENAECDKRNAEIDIAMRRGIRLPAREELWEEYLEVKQGHTYWRPGSAFDYSSKDYFPQVDIIES